MVCIVLGYTYSSYRPLRFYEVSALNVIVIEFSCEEERTEKVARGSTWEADLRYQESEAGFTRVGVNGIGAGERYAGRLCTRALEFGYMWRMKVTAVYLSYSTRVRDSQRR